MAWEWSHTQEAYQNAELNLRDQPKAWLEACWAEIMAFTLTCRKDCDELDGWSEAYKKSLTLSCDMSQQELAEEIWEFMSGDLRTCDNGGFDAWCCPYGCHTVPFDREEEEEEG